MTLVSWTDSIAGNVSRETVEKLIAFEVLVLKWNPSINLVSKESAKDLGLRHIVDSCQVFDLIDLKEGIWTDLGSGGGFPGIVVAILAQEKSPKSTIHLVESDTRKATFLREAARQLAIPVVVINQRIENLLPENAQVISARALAPLVDLCAFANRHLASGGRAIFPKGATYQDEIAEAQKRWVFDLKVHPSKTNMSAAILELWNIRDV